MSAQPYEPATDEEKAQAARDLAEAGDPEVDAEAERQRERIIRREHSGNRDQRVIIGEPNGVECGNCGDVGKAPDPAQAILGACKTCGCEALLPVIISPCPMKPATRDRCPSLDHHAASGQHVLSVQP